MDAWRCLSHENRDPRRQRRRQLGIQFCKLRVELGQNFSWQLSWKGRVGHFKHLRRPSESISSQVWPVPNSSAPPERIGADFSIAHAVFSTAGSQSVFEAPAPKFEAASLPV